mmetsp:Transcript_25471/g.31315  ORF Transcript_25471/g.31315 Transcript_25471/m.31315 type:complete len:110 (-) Transcript_25471:234-563(-)
MFWTHYLKYARSIDSKRGGKPSLVRNPLKLRFATLRKVFFARLSPVELRIRSGRNIGGGGYDQGEKALVFPSSKLGAIPFGGGVRSFRAEPLGFRPRDSEVTRFIPSIL